MAPRVCLLPPAASVAAAVSSKPSKAPQCGDGDGCLLLAASQACKEGSSSSSLQMISQAFGRVL